MRTELSDIAKSIADNIGCPYSYYPKGSGREMIVNGYCTAMERGEKEGFIPVIVAVDDILAEQLEIMKDDGYSVADTLEQDAKGGEEFLRKRYSEYFDDAAGEQVFDGKKEALTGIYCIDDARDGVLIFEIPTRKPWEIAAYIPFGGWNDCPSPDEMAAVLRYWYEKYGAVPVAITHDTLEMSVPEPVGEEKAAELAREHCAFTPDRAWQCTASGTIAEVAASLAISPIWFFWWD